MTWRDRFDELDVDKLVNDWLRGEGFDDGAFTAEEVEGWIIDFFNNKGKEILKSFIEEVVRERDTYWTKKIKKIIKVNTVDGYASFQGIALDVMQLGDKLDDLKERVSATMKTTDKGGEVT